jgi:hypothetical protein
MEQGGEILDYIDSLTTTRDTMEDYTERGHNVWRETSDHEESTITCRETIDLADENGENLEDGWTTWPCDIDHKYRTAYFSKVQAKSGDQRRPLFVVDFGTVRVVSRG